MPDPPPESRGESLPWDEIDLDDLAEVTPADVEEAAEFWRAEAPTRFVGLVDAKSTDEDED